MTYDAPLHNEVDEQVTTPAEALKDARDFFLKQFGIKTNEDGLLNAADIEAQRADLIDWSRESFPHQMPTPELFYRKTLLFLSWWPQEQSGQNAFVAGKGWGAELALQGEVVGRQKRQKSIPLRSHSDFEVYNVRDLHNASGEWQRDNPPTPEGFLPVFSPVEAFPPGTTKYFGFPHDYFETNFDIVDVGGIQIKVPKLEFLFFEKMLHPESESSRGYDFQLLAKFYNLDAQLIHQYFDDFFIPTEEARFLENLPWDISAQRMYAERYLQTLVPAGRQRMKTSIVSDFNSHAKEKRDEGHQTKGVYWMDIHEDQINEKGEIIDPDFNVKIEKHIKNANQDYIRELGKFHQKIDEVLG